MKIQSAKIKTGDYPADQKILVEKLGKTLNPFNDDLVLAFNKNLTVEDNLPFEFKTVDIKVDGSGTPTSNATQTTGLTNFKGYICINVIDINNSGVYPLSTPFLSTDIKSTSVVIRHITGLTSGITYRLVLLGIS